ncbi:YifB family Mg chelatase-like AAA ATPase [Candidatus Parcubacteria bacterium]|jgi:magnesium chelatase family protein|nr:YifB family Mg chelatase-like AAA ATPase [Candidatus Parcubacteria bacterium]
MNKVYTIAPIGLKGVLVEVETNFSRHLPKIIVVGLPDTAVQEAKERVWAAIENSNLQFPRKKVVINLAPAQIRKEGGAYDLSIAISVLQTNGDVILPDKKIAFIGELSLLGEVKAVPGVLVMVASLKDMGFKQVFLPAGNAKEAGVLKGIEIYPVKTLKQLIGHLTDKESIGSLSFFEFKPRPAKAAVDLADVKGQLEAKRVLEIAAAGGHNLLMVGPPGAGKTLMAKSFLSVLPEMTIDEALEVSKVHSLAGLLSEDNYLIDSRLLRSPHHSASVSAIVGGGSWPRPGEISLAHHNILFLDEILEFPRQVLEALRQPLEDKLITVSRVRGSLDFPANFILLATANPCPCGYLVDQDKNCVCSAADIKRYQKRLSGPLLDRIDLHLLIKKVKSGDLSGSDVKAERSSIVQQRVNLARIRQSHRFKGDKFNLNADIEPKAMQIYCQITDSSKQILQQAVDRLQLSARAYFKILKVARTIADLGDDGSIKDEHILEALQYRNKVFGA